MNTDSTMTVSEAAQRLDVTEEAIRQAVRRGRIKAIKLGTMWWLNAESVRDYEASRQPTGPRPNPTVTELSAAEDERKATSRSQGRYE